MGLAEDFENIRIKQYKKQFNIEERRMFLFKCFISFLELWGDENYGNSSIVDWVKVYNYVCNNNIITSSIEIDNLIYNEDLNPESDEFRDKVYKFIEDHVIKDVPMHTFFKLSPWLKRKLDEEINNKRGSASYGPKGISDKWVMNDKVMKKHCSGFVPSDKVKNYDDYIKLYYNI